MSSDLQNTSVVSQDATIEKYILHDQSPTLVWCEIKVAFEVPSGLSLPVADLEI